MTAGRPNRVAAVWRMSRRSEAGSVKKASATGGHPRVERFERPGRHVG